MRERDRERERAQVSTLFWTSAPNPGTHHRCVPAAAAAEVKLVMARHES